MAATLWKEKVSNLCAHYKLKGHKGVPKQAFEGLRAQCQQEAEQATVSLCDLKQKKALGQALNVDLHEMAQLTDGVPKQKAATSQPIMTREDVEMGDAGAEQALRAPRDCLGRRTRLSFHESFKKTQTFTNSIPTSIP